MACQQELKQKILDLLTRSPQTITEIAAKLHVEPDLVRRLTVDLREAKCLKETRSYRRVNTPHGLRTRNVISYVALEDYEKPTTFPEDTHLICIPGVDAFCGQPLSCPDATPKGVG